MRKEKLRGCVCEDGEDEDHPPRISLQQAAPDLVGRNFAAEEPDRLWVAEITYVRSRERASYT